MPADSGIFIFGNGAFDFGRKATGRNRREGSRTMEDKNLTIADIAQELGVSKTTVSRAMSGKGRIGEETRKRVQAYIETHHYSPNVVAKGLAQSKTCVL